jgi:hypothetical protein
MGFSVGASQCLVAPPYAFAAIVMYAAGVIGDKYHTRGPIIVFNAILAIVGLAIMGFVKPVGVRYFGGMTCLTLLNERSTEIEPSFPCMRRSECQCPNCDGLPGTAI